jgi:hypothetical protein
VKSAAGARALFTEAMKASVFGLLFGLIAFTTLGVLVLLYMTEVGAEVFLAVIAALTPPAAP